VFYWETIVRYSLCSSLLVCLLVIPALSDTLIDDFQVNSNFPGHPPQKAPYAVANWETETIYLTWLSQHDGEYWDVAFNRFDYDLDALGDATYLNIRTNDADCRQPRLVLSDNGFGAAWIEDDEPNQMLFRSFDALGNPLSNPIDIVDDNQNVMRDSLSIAALNDGYLLVWYDLRDSSKVWAQKVGIDGNLTGDNFPIRPDSTGSLLGIEAQNHPDGRVLVSWVVDGMYSRARWLDADGEFMGDVFEIQDDSITGGVKNSSIRFGTNSVGILFQHATVGNGPGYGAYITDLDSNAMALGNPEHVYLWYYESYESYGYTYWPSLLHTNNYEIVRTHFRWVRYTMQGETTSTYNFHFSSINNFTEWATWTNNSYQLCQLDDDFCLYSFSTGFLGLEKLDITTVEPVDTVAWIYEPEWDQEQSKPDIIAHDNEGFRLIYNSRIGAEERLFSRFFDDVGIPSSAEVLVSMDESLSTIHTLGGRIEITASDEALVMWLGYGEILGTMYDGPDWTGLVDSFECEAPVGQFVVPEMALDNQDHLLLTWEEDWWDHTGSSYEGTLYFQSFDNYYQLFGNEVGISPLSAPQYIEYDCALRDDGRFAVFFRNPLTLVRGIDYDEIIGEPLVVYDLPWSYFSFKTSPTGYLFVVVYDSVRLQIMDSDANLVGNSFVISDSTAVPTGNPDLAVSQAGNFAVCWQDARYDEGDIFCRQFNLDGSFYGYVYRVNSDPVGPLQKEPAVAFGPNDQLYFTWTDFRDPDHSGDIYCKVIEWEDAIGVEPEKEPVPLTFALHPLYPNPFNPTTMITFDLPVASQVELKVSDVQGRLVVSGSGATPTTEFYPAGTHTIQFDGTGLASGIYFVQLKAGEYSAIQKMVLLK